MTCLESRPWLEELRKGGRLGTRALKLEDGEAEKNEAWGGRVGFYPLIWTANMERPPSQALKLAYSEGVVQTARLGFPNPY